MVLFASEYAPVALLKNPLVLLESDKTPVAVLKPPLVSLFKARRPVAVFWLPPVRWLSAWKPVPLFQTPVVRLTSTPIPSPLLEPAMAPSVSGPTACAIGASPKQASESRLRNPPMARFLDFLMDGNVVFMCFFYVFFLLFSPTSYSVTTSLKEGRKLPGGSILWPNFRFMERVVQKIRELVK